MADFSKALKALMRAEGGYVLHKVRGDRGGAHAYAGISQRSWKDWAGWETLKKKELTKQDVGYLKGLVFIFYQVQLLE